MFLHLQSTCGQITQDLFPSSCDQGLTIVNNVQCFSSPLLKRSFSSSVFLLFVFLQVLRFDSDRLRANLQFCEKGYPLIKRSQDAHPSVNFDTYLEAQDLVNQLWETPSSLERSPNIQ